VTSREQQRYERLGRLIAERRVELELSQTELARRAHLGRADNPDGRTIRNLERGVARPRMSTKYGVERALGWRRYSIDEYLAGGDEPTPDERPEVALGDDEIFVHRNLSAVDANTLRQIRQMVEQALDE